MNITRLPYTRRKLLENLNRPPSSTAARHRRHRLPKESEPVRRVRVARLDLQAPTDVSGSTGLVSIMVNVAGLGELAGTMQTTAAGKRHGFLFASRRQCGFAVKVVP